MLVQNDELISLVRSVFPAIDSDKQLALLFDIPSNPKNDTPAWQNRRSFAYDWFNVLTKASDSLGLKINLYAYPDIGSNNADLPGVVYQVTGPLPANSEQLAREGRETSLNEMFATQQMFFALTQFSATAPLKIAAKRFGFRAATMPGFTEAMVPALKSDFNLVDQRCKMLKDKLDYADKVKCVFLVDGQKRYHVDFDLFQRTAHVSSGRFETPGTAGNFPSGETYIVPYEGGLGAISQSIGYLPVQFGDEVVLYRIRQNKITKVLSDGKKSQSERKYVKSEPAYANVAELGFGVLGDFGLKPIGEILLDEKLGFHIAFGRSDHFGGIVGPEQFSSPAAVVHLDRIFLPEIQPRVQVALVELEYSGGVKEKIIVNNKYQLW